MIGQETIDVLKICFSIFVLWFFWYYLWKDYALDKYRQDLFSLRDGLFDLIAERQIAIDFDSPYYRNFRAVINGSIRFGHTMNLSRVLVFLFFSRVFGYDPGELIGKYSLEFDTIDDNESRKIFLRFERQYRILIIKHLAMTSPLFLVSTLFTIVFLLFKAIMRRASNISGSIKFGTKLFFKKTIQNVNIQAGDLSIVRK